jgi:ABC-type branched-subunit amino acid transport system substrate-binding protein
MADDDPNDNSVGTTRRRRFLELAGAAALTTGGLAGCIGTESSDGGDGGGGDGSDGSDGSDGGDGGNGSGATETATEGGDGGGATETATGTPSGPDSVLVGQPAAITGRWDFLQVSATQATDLAAQEINDAGGPLGAEFNVQRRDTAVDPQQARQVIRQFVNSDGVDAVTGLFSSEVVPLWDFLQEQQVPVVTPWPGTRFLDTRGGDKSTPGDLSDDEWVWRTVIGDTVDTAGGARAAIDEGFETMGILNGTSAGETGYADAFQTAYENLGGTVATRVEVPEGESSYQSQIDRLFGADFDAWLLALTLEDATVAVRNWRQGGYGGGLVLESGLLAPDLISAVGEQAEGALAAAGTTQGPGFSDFEPKFQEAGDGELHTWAVSAYDSINILALAMHRAGEASHEAVQRNIGPVARGDGTAVQTFAEGKEALDAGEEINYQGALTNADFTQHGNVWGDVRVAEVTPDGFETRSVIEASTLRESIDIY